MYIATNVPLPSQWRLPGTLSPPPYSPSQCPVQVLWGWSKSLLGFFHVTEKPKQAFKPSKYMSLKSEVMLPELKPPQCILLCS